MHFGNGLPAIGLLKARPKEEAFEEIDQWQSHMPAGFLRDLPHFKTFGLYELIESFIELLALNDHSENCTYLQGFQDAVLDFTKNTKGDLQSFFNLVERGRPK